MCGGGHSSSRLVARLFRGMMCGSQEENSHAPKEGCWYLSNNYLLNKMCELWQVSWGQLEAWSWGKFESASWGRFNSPTCSYLNFDLNFAKFPNSEVGNFKLRLKLRLKLCRKLASSWGALKHPIATEEINDIYSLLATFVCAYVFLITSTSALYIEIRL